MTNEVFRPAGVPYLSWVTGREQEEDQSRYDKRLSSDHSTSFMSSIQNVDCRHIMHSGVSMVFRMACLPSSMLPTTPPVVARNIITTSRGCSYLMASRVTSLSWFLYLGSHDDLHVLNHLQECVSDFPVQPESLLLIIL